MVLSDKAKKNFKALVLVIIVLLFVWSIAYGWENSDTGFTNKRCHGVKFKENVCAGVLIQHECCGLYETDTLVVQEK